MRKRAECTASSVIVLHGVVVVLGGLLHVLVMRGHPIHRVARGLCKVQAVQCHCGGKQPFEFQTRDDCTGIHGKSGRNARCRGRRLMGGSRGAWLEPAGAAPNFCPGGMFCGQGMSAETCKKSSIPGSGSPPGPYPATAAGCPLLDDGPIRRFSRLTCSWVSSTAWKGGGKKKKDNRTSSTRLSRGHKRRGARSSKSFYRREWNLQQRMRHIL